MLKPYIKKVVEGRDLTAPEAAAAMTLLMQGGAEDPQIAALAVALRMKGESAAEIAGFARAIRARALRLPEAPRDVADTCGTGGDSLDTVNVSTLAALAAAGAGLRVAKHGNRSVTSRCGSADLLEAMGVEIDMQPPRASEALRRFRFAFLLAPSFHPALKIAAAARRSIGVRTVFNLLGPLCNPAEPRTQVIGLADPSRLEVMASAARSLGIRRVLVVHGSDGMDELTVTGTTRCVEVRDGKLRALSVRPEDAGLRRHPLRALRCRAPEENARRAAEVLEGRKGAARDVVLLNAAAVLHAGGAARSLREGARAAAEAIDTGRAAAVLDDLRAFSRGAGA